MLLRIFALCLFIQCSFAAEETFILIDGMTDEIILQVGPNTQISPCSTFKIALSLMGYDTEVLIDQTNPKWDFQEGYDDMLTEWKATQCPESWMKCSCIWYSKVLSVKLGLQKIQNYLTTMEYGNQDASGGLIDPGPINPFWVNSSLKITPKEQVKFIQKMVRNQLPFSCHAIEVTKANLFREKFEGWKLFGKTGWSGSNRKTKHGWFVGWIENDQSFYPFAYLIQDKKIDLDQRVPRVKQFLKLANEFRDAEVDTR